MIPCNNPTDTAVPNRFTTSNANIGQIMKMAPAMDPGAMNNTEAIICARGPMMGLSAIPNTAISTMKILSSVEIFLNMIVHHRKSLDENQSFSQKKENTDLFI